MENILLLCPSFYNYRDMIKTELEKQGYNVYAFDERPSNSTWFKIALRLFGSKLLLPITKRYYHKMLADMGSKGDIDKILIINPEALGNSTLYSLKNAYPKAKVVLYLWDSLKNKKYIYELFHHCDKIYSFDYIDAKNKGFNFLPLFFSVSKRDSFGTEKNKLVFIGSVHSTRISIISAFCKLAKKENIKFNPYLYFQSRIILFYLFLKSSELRTNLLRNIILKPVPYSQYLEEMSSADFVLDVAHPKQTGLTMRTMEAIAFGKKIITTNPNIKYYDFFNPQMHLVLNEFNESEIMKFIKEAPANRVYSSVVLDKYSISNWVMTLLEKK